MTAVILNKTKPTQHYLYELHFEQVLKQTVSDYSKILSHRIEHLYEDRPLASAQIAATREAIREIMPLLWSHQASRIKPDYAKPVRAWCKNCDYVDPEAVAYFDNASGTVRDLTTHADGLLCPVCSEAYKDIVDRQLLSLSFEFLPASG